MGIDGAFLMIKSQITYEDFDKVDIRVGKVTKVEDFPEARKSAYKLWIDFGEEIGIKTSSAQLPGAHPKEELQNRLVIAVVNFPQKQVGPLGEGFVLVTPAKDTVKIGDKLR